MGSGKSIGLSAALAVALVAAAFPTAAAAACDEPAEAWSAADPATQGLDGTALARAIHAYQDRRAYAVRIYRNGCLVGSDTGAGNRTAQFETWEITSAVVGLLAIRQIELGLLSPDDPVGALLPEADGAHGAITIRDLMARTSGLAAEPDNTFFSDRLRRALARPLATPPGHRFGDAPVARALLVAALERAAGQDLQSFATQELFGPLGIRGFRWTRDGAGTTNGSFGLALSADDLARLAEVVRRAGVWRGRRLLGAAALDEALAPGRRNPCHGWLTWLNAAGGCNGDGLHLFPGLPPDLWTWRGRYDQRVVVIPTLGLMIVRFGASGGDARSADDQATWELGVLRMVLAAVRDRTPASTPVTGSPPVTDEPYTDDARAATEAPPPLPAAGPRRARAPQVTLVRAHAGRQRLVGVRIACPRLPQRGCEGTARLNGLAAREKAWTVPAGHSRIVQLRLRRRPRTDQDATITVVATDDAGGVAVSLPLRVRR